MYGTLHDDALALPEPLDDLHALAVRGARHDGLLAVARFVELDVDEVDALLLGEGRDGQADDPLPRGGVETS